VWQLLPGNTPIYDKLTLSMSNQIEHLPYDLSGHVALITGANHGIGAATASALARCGASVLISYLQISDPEDLPEPYRSNRAKDASEVVSAIRSFGGKISEMAADLRDTSVVPKLFDFAEAEFGPVDILVNNATGWVALPGVLWLGIAQDHRWQAARIGLESQAISIVLILGGVARAWSNFDQANPLTWIFIGGMTLLLLIIVVVYGWLEFGRR
jgi:hypothetical protein